MHSTIDSGTAHDLILENGRYRTLRSVLTGDVDLSLEGPIVHFLDPAGVDRTVRLPPLDEGRFYIITNVGTVGRLLVVDYDFELIQALDPTDNNYFIASSEEWAVVASGAAGVFQGAGPDAKKGLVPSPGPTVGLERFLKDDGTWSTLVVVAADAYKTLTDGVQSVTAEGLDTLKVRAVSSKISVVLQNNDPSHGDNIALDVVPGNIFHDDLGGVSADKHVDHSLVQIGTALNSGLSGGGNITQTRNIAIDISNLPTGTLALDGSFVYRTAAGVHRQALLSELNSTLQHNDLAGYAAGRHVDHAGVSIIAGEGLEGGGTIESSRSLSLSVSGLLEETPVPLDELLFYDVSEVGHRKTTIEAFLSAVGDARFQPLDEDLTQIAALVPVNDEIIQRKSNAWARRTPAQFKVDLALVKGDVGLANVDNTSDANKPVSGPTQTALNAKENSIAAGTATQYWRGDKTFQTLDKAAVGLANVDNTSDAAKPISSATQTALNAKQASDADLTAIAALAPANDDILQRKASAWTNRTPAQFKVDLALTKGDVGLGNVDNTSDLEKPISSATQDALDAKANLAGANFTGAVTVPSLTANAGNISIDRSGDAAGATFLLAADAGQVRDIVSRSGALNRWLLRMAGPGAETGDNAGSDFALWRYDDSGVAIGTAFAITRSTGILAFTVTPTAPTPADSEDSLAVANTAFVKNVAQPLDATLTALAAAPAPTTEAINLRTTLGLERNFENQVANPRFESGDVEWTKGSGWVIETDAANSLYGDNVAKNTSVAGVSSFLSTPGTAGIPVEPGETIYAYGWMKTDANFDGLFRIRIQFLNKSGANVLLSPGTTYTTVQTSYVKSEITVVAPVGAVSYIFLFEASKTAGTVWAGFGHASRVVPASNIADHTHEIADTTGLQADLNEKVERDGSIAMTGPLTLSGNPTNPLHSAPKQYVDALAVGLKLLPAADLATTGNITLSGEQAVDGVTTTADRVLVRMQTAPAQNGLYRSGAGAWTREPDMDAWDEVTSAIIPVSFGNTLANTMWATSVDPGGTLGTTAITINAFPLFQPLSGRLTDIAAVATTNDNILQVKAGVWTGRTPAQFKVDLSLVKADVGLGNVDNTSDADKPVSSATQSALDLKANLSGATFTGSVSATAVNANAGGITVNRVGDAAAAQFIANADAGMPHDLVGQVGGLFRWILRFGDGTTESGANVGNNLALFRYDDTGAFLGTIFTVTRSTGVMNFLVSPTAPTPAAADNTTRLATTAWVRTFAQPLDAGLTALAAAPARSTESRNIRIMLELEKDFTNLAFNPGFESGDFEWTKQTGWTIENDPTNAFSGNWVAKHVTAAGTFALITNSKIPAIPGDIFRAKVRYKTSADYAATSSRFYIQFLNSVSGSSGQVISGILPVSTSYTEIEIEGVVPANTVSLDLRVWTVNQTAGSIWFDNFEIFRLIEPVAHVHLIEDITDLETELAAKQPLDADLTTIGGLAPADDTILQRKASAWAARTPAQVKVDLALVKGDVGLGNVDNTSDLNKPISTDTQTALNAKEATIAAGTTSQYWRGDKSWQTLDKSAVGLSNVDNTSDANKPVSSATQTALNAKQDSHANLTEISAIVGADNDIIQQKTGAWVKRTPAQFKVDLALVKGDVGLGNVDNTSDANKPISTATQTALNGKEATIAAGTTAQYWRGDKSWQTLDKTAVGLANVDNTSDANKPISSATQAALDLKQAIHANLTEISAIVGADNDIIQQKAGAWVKRTPAQFKPDLALVKGDVGLGNVDNTSDLLKPLSNAAVSALAGKQPLDATLTELAATPAYASQATSLRGTLGLIRNFENQASNPGFTGGNEWAGQTGWTLVQDAANAYWEDWVAKHTGAATNSSLFPVTLSSTPILPGEKVYAFAKLKTSADYAGSLCRVYIQWLDKDFAGVNPLTFGTNFTTPQTTYTESVVTAEAPVGTAYYQVRVQITKTAGTVYVGYLHGSRVVPIANIPKATIAEAESLTPVDTAFLTPLTGKALVDIHKPYVVTSRADLADVHVPAHINHLITMGYSVVGDLGDANMKRVGADPGHPGGQQSDDGGWWEPQNQIIGLNSAAFGVKGDGVLTTLVGTDNTNALQKAINTGFHTILLPPGVIFCDGPIFLLPYQRLVGHNRRIVPNTNEGLGTLLFARYTGSNESFLQSKNSTLLDAPFPWALFENFSVACRSTCIARYLMDLWTPRNCAWQNIYMLHQNTGLVDGAGAGANGGGCIRTRTIRWGAGGVGDDQEVDDEKWGASWTNFLTSVTLETSLDRTDAFGDEANYFNYGYGLLSDATAWHINSSDMQNATMRLTHGGGVQAGNSTFENTGAGQLAPGNSSPRACIILQNDALLNNNANVDISGSFSACNITQGGTGIIVDARAGSGIVAVGFSGGGKCRRNWYYDAELFAHTGGTAGMSFGDMQFLGHEITGGPQEPRIRIVGPWSGLTMGTNIRQIPDEEITHREVICAWDPPWGGASLGPVGVAAPTVVPSLTASQDFAVTNSITQIKRARATSAAGAGSSATIFQPQKVCWRGNAAGLGGFFTRFRWAMPTMVASKSRGFFGLYNQVTQIANADPCGTGDPITGGLLQAMGVGFNGNHTTWRLIRAQNAATVPLDLGIPIVAGQIYDLIICCLPNSTRVKFRFECIDTGEWRFVETPNQVPGQGNTSPQIISDPATIPVVSPPLPNEGDPAGQLPSAAQTFAPHFWHNNGAAPTSAVDLVVFAWILKTMTPRYAGRL